MSQPMENRDSQRPAGGDAELQHTGQGEHAHRAVADKFLPKKVMIFF